MKCIKKENGMLIVEATIVFPVMFLVIFLMLVSGNAYLQKCRVESIVQTQAISGASFCSDPLLENISTTGIPSIGDMNIKPYRYLIGGMNSIEDKITENIENKIRNLSTGLFSGMKPSNVVVNVEYNSGFLHSSFSVDVRYKVKLPIKLLGASDFIFMSVSSHSDVPVSDSSEFIRNIDLVDDYMERYGAKDKIEEMISKVKSWFKK